MLLPGLFLADCPVQPQHPLPSQVAARWIIVLLYTLRYGLIYNYGQNSTIERSNLPFASSSWILQTRTGGGQAIWPLRDQEPVLWEFGHLRCEACETPRRVSSTIWAPGSSKFSKCLLHIPCQAAGPCRALHAGHVTVLCHRLPLWPPIKL